VSAPRPAEPAFLCMGLLVSEGVDPGALLDAVAGALAPVRLATPLRPFRHTRYYEPEMGPGIRRGYVLLEGTWDPGDLAGIKLRSNELERAWSRQGRRRANLDPGVLNLEQFVLASGKPAAHRVYLGQGIYAEVEYVFQRGSFRPLPWTYPDYRESDTVSFFNQVRAMYRQHRRGRP